MLGVSWERFDDLMSAVFWDYFGIVSGQLGNVLGTSWEYEFLGVFLGFFRFSIRLISIILIHYFIDIFLEILNYQQN